MIYFDQLNEESEYVGFCKTVYEEAFPNDERRNFCEAVRLQRTSPTFFYVIRDDDTPIGLCVVWKFDHFVFVEHLAIDKSVRGKNYGSRIMDIIKKKYKNIFFEVEPAELGKIATIRIRWYEKLGFVLNEWDFLMPSLGEGKSPVVLKIMSEHLMSYIEFKKATDLLYQNVYSGKTIK